MPLGTARVVMMRRPSGAAFSPADLNPVLWTYGSHSGTLRGDTSNNPYTGPLDDASAIAAAMSGGEEVRISAWDGAGSIDWSQTSGTSQQPYWLQSQINGKPAADFRSAQTMFSSGLMDAIWTAGTDTTLEFTVLFRFDTLLAEQWIINLPRAFGSSDWMWAARARSGTFEVVYRNNSGGASFLTSTVTAGAWRFLRVSKDGANIQAWLDGTSIGSASDAQTTVLSSGTGAANIRLGGLLLNLSRIDGQIADVMIRKSVLTTQERSDQDAWIETTFGLTIA